MDVLLSLPIVSYFAAPMLTSWSTSLNLLFFYMTWTTLVLSQSPLHIELAGTLAVRVVFWLVPSLLFLVFDALIPSLAESLKHYGRASLPARRRTAVALVGQVLLAVANLLILTAVQAAGSAAATRFLHRPPFRASTALPLPWQIVKNVLALYTAREVLTYYINRYVLHGGGALANLHARYAHGRRGAAPYALMLYADHPLTLLLHRLVPAYLPALFVRPHLLTYFLFTVLTTVEEMLSMSGYSIVPGIIMGGIARRTAAHYASGGKGNYGAWGLLDWIHGTSVGKDVVEDINDEAEKHRASDTGSMVQDGIDSFKKRQKGRKKT